ncbi:MAG: hypothetical protein LBI26_01805 [Holosporales bacterium]|jgi:hypothetical protein|nr:hypothetical protein [Holosporales bacterium]
MKKNKKEHLTLSDKAYFSHYSQHGFFALFVSSLIQHKYSILKEIGISLLFSLCSFLLIDISKIDRPREFIAVVSTGLTTYSITTIGFLLVSFSLLIVLNSSNSIFRYFSLEDSNYRKPLLSVLLSSFIIPIGVFIALLFFSMVISFLLPVYSINQFCYKTKRFIFKCLMGISVFLFVYSIQEFFSFFYNIYSFIVVSSHNMARDYEQEIIKETVLPGMPLETDKDKEKIIENIKKEIKNHTEVPLA